MDYLLELFKSIDYMHYYYAFLAALLSAVWCFTRSSRTIDSVNESTQMNLQVDGVSYVHPEIQSGKARAGIYSFFGIVFVAITLFAGFAGYVRQDLLSLLAIEDTVNSTKWKVNSTKWKSTPYERTFVTNGRFNDASSIEIKYDLIITLPDKYQLQALKDTFRTPGKLFDHYMQSYLYAITVFSTAQRTAYEAYETKRKEFIMHIRNQVLNGADPALGLRSSDGYKSFKRYGIGVKIRSINFTFDPAFLKHLLILSTDVEQKNKAKTDLEIAEPEAETMQRQYKATNGLQDDLMKEWIESGRDKKKNK